MPKIGKSQHARNYVASTRVPSDIHHWLQDYAKKNGKRISDVLYEWILDIHERDTESSRIRNATLRKRLEVKA